MSRSNVHGKWDKKMKNGPTKIPTDFSRAMMEEKNRRRRQKSREDDGISIYFRNSRDTNPNNIRFYLPVNLYIYQYKDISYITTVVCTNVKNRSRHLSTAFARIVVITTGNRRLDQGFCRTIGFTTISLPPPPQSIYNP